MANGKIFMNKKTGEVIWRKCRLSAYIYFKADGKKFGYKVGYKDILNADGIFKEFGIIFGKDRQIA